MKKYQNDENVIKSEDKEQKAIQKEIKNESSKAIKKSKQYNLEENENQLKEKMKEINDSQQMEEVNKELRLMEIEELKHQLKETDIIQTRSNSLNPISSLNETQILSSDFESICEMKERENVSHEINENENKIMTLLDFDSNELYQLFFTISETGDLQINTNLPIDINNMTGNSVTKSVWEIMINEPITEEELNKITNEILKEKVRKLFMNRGVKYYIKILRETNLVMKKEIEVLNKLNDLKHQQENNVFIEEQFPKYILVKYEENIRGHKQSVYPLIMEDGGITLDAYLSILEKS